ncbi:MAG: hypothetical protein KAR22_24925, partial [Gammaproteobacteria bacterium]|nr:hypothetical protein [Gammaproteobacteria bacterium]
AGEMDGPVPVSGGRRQLSEIELRATHFADLERFPEPDPSLAASFRQLFSDRDSSYGFALLDITPGRPLRFASLRSDDRFAPGSVGKLAIAAGLFAELRKRFPDSIAARQELLRERMIVADRWIVHDAHKVPLFDPDSRRVGFRRIAEGDTFSLYEWCDHMLSASANAAASTVWKELLLMRGFGRDYPPSPEQEQRFFDDTPRETLRGMALSVVNDPLREAGISGSEWQLGSFFTRTGKRIVPGAPSYASPKALLIFLLRMEQGRLVDEWTSLELKRLMYMTEKRIRYASSPRLTKAAVFFKSGSLYRCKEEPDFKCGKYKGNVDNYMNSVAIVEQPDGRIYLVALMSNVLRINSAVEHQTLATYIDRILSRND